MIAETLAFALVLAVAPAARRSAEPAAKARSAVGAPSGAAQASGAGTDNATRARRGLLPRKAARSRPAAMRGRRIVLLPGAPTWLGEPGGGTDPVVEAAAFEPPDEREAAPLRAAVEGAAVALVLFRRVADAGGHPSVRAQVEGVEVGAVLLRRGARDPR